MMWAGDRNSVGSLFAYDADGLDSLLKANSELLKSFGWPEDPDAFVRLVAKHNVPPLSNEYKLYGLIADAFADDMAKKLAAFVGDTFNRTKKLPSIEDLSCFKERIHYYRKLG